MSERYAGGCFCEAVRYEVDGPLQPANMCHCSMCRKRFGGTGSAMTFVAKNNFAWVAGEDQLTQYGSPWGLGFCSKCGSTLVGIKDGAVVGITLSSLDPDPPVEIKHHLFVGSKANWDEIGDDAPQWHEWPES